jgi:hypothetical protein
MIISASEWVGMKSVDQSTLMIFSILPSPAVRGEPLTETRSADRRFRIWREMAARQLFGA